MAVVSPFRGWRYSQQAAPNLSQVIAPPYDVISPAQQDDLHRMSPHNVVQLEFGKPRPTDNDGDNVYTRAAALLRTWREQGVLAREDKPAFYLIEESFEAEGQRLRRLALFAAVTLEPFERGVILPHEETTSGPKADRMRLMEAVHANISPVMVLYEDPGDIRQALDHQMKTVKPATGTFSTGGVRYKLWAITDTAVHAHLRVAFDRQQLFIADGHHRYETALAFSRGAGKNDQGAKQIMMSLIDMKDPGLHVQSFHRVLRDLSPAQMAALRTKWEAAFDVRSSTRWQDASQAARSLTDALEVQGESICAVGVLEDGGRKATLLRLKPDAQMPTPPIPEFRECEPWVLHRAVIDPALGEAAPSHLSFPHGLDEVASLLEKGEAQMAFLVRAIPLGLFRRLVSKGQRLPPKATFFYPKLPTGIVLRTLDE
ncbi:MAG: DUF1015 domain-containing protein [Dehalococcoidia bacterium]|nr:DUF1015 domain-containing protein [Dehalococcoidia bacterium]